MMWTSFWYLLAFVFRELICHGYEQGYSIWCQSQKRKQGLSARWPECGRREADSPTSGRAERSEAWRTPTAKPARPKKILILFRLEQC